MVTLVSILMSIQVIGCVSVLNSYVSTPDNDIKFNLNIGCHKSTNLNVYMFF